MTYIQEKIDIANKEITLANLMKNYIHARNDFSLEHKNIKDLEKSKNEMDFYEDKISKKLFELWMKGQITIKFE